MPIRSSAQARVGRVTLEAPQRLNALDSSMWRDLRAAFVELAARDDLDCIVLRGAGGNFAAGADITEFPRVRHDPASARRYHLEWIAPALEAIAEAPQPVVAAIEGACVGGGLELACACDLRVAATGSRLGAPVGRLGFPLALPELAALLRVVGSALAADLLLTGRLLDPAEALSCGLVQRVADAGRFEAELEALLQAVLTGSPRAARLNKRHLRLLAVQGGRATAEQIDRSFGCFDSADYREGIAAFLERRAPRFGGG